MGKLSGGGVSRSYVFPLLRSNQHLIWYLIPTSMSHFTDLPIRSDHSLLASHQGIKLWYLLLKIMGHLFHCSFWDLENMRHSWLQGLSLHLKEASLPLSGQIFIISLSGCYFDSLPPFQATPVHNPGSFPYQKSADLQSSFHLQT